jgi:PD-(D/E)XK nuclease superfamily protein
MEDKTTGATGIPARAFFIGVPTNVPGNPRRVRKSHSAIAVAPAKGKSNRHGPGKPRTRPASQRGGLARHENTHGSRTPLAQASRRIFELAFFYKAAGLGFGVVKPWGDSERYDFILDSGQRLWRVQVKSGCDYHNRYYDLQANCGSNEKALDTSGEIDMFVAYLVPIDVWYVIPVDKIKKKSLLFFPSGGARCSHYEQYREAWSLMAPQTSSASFLASCLQNNRARPGYLNPRFL